MGEQEKRRQYLIQALLRERPEYEAMEIPMQEDEQRQLCLLYTSPSPRDS